MNSDFNLQKQEEPNLLEIIRPYISFWPLFVILTFITFTASLLYLRYTPPQYEIKGKILVKDEKKGMTAPDVLESLDLLGGNKIVENEMDILKSWPLMQDVVKDLHLYSSLYAVGYVTDSELYGEQAPVRIISSEPDRITSIKKPVPLSIDFKNRSINIQGKNYKAGDSILIDGNKLYFEWNESYKAPQINSEYYVTLTNVYVKAQSLLDDLEIETTSKLSSVIVLKYKTILPKQGEDLMNTLFTTYQKTSLADKNSVASNTLKFVEDRLGFVTKELDSIEAGFENFKKKEGIVDISEQSKLLLNVIQKNDEQVSQINVQLSVLKDIEKYVNGKGINPGTVPSLIGINDATLISLLERLYEAESKYASLQKVTGQKNDVLEQLSGEINTLKPAILENIQNIRSNLSTAVAKLKNEASGSTQLLKIVPEKERAFIEISRQQAIKNTIYTFLLRARGKKLPCHTLLRCMIAD